MCSMYTDGRVLCATENLGPCGGVGSAVILQRHGRLRLAIKACRAGPPSVPDARSSQHPAALFRPCLRPSERVPARSVSSKPPPAALGAGLTGRNGPGRARTIAIRAGAALTGAVRTALGDPPRLSPHKPPTCRQRPVSSSLLLFLSLSLPP